MIQKIQVIIHTIPNFVYYERLMGVNNDNLCTQNAIIRAFWRWLRHQTARVWFGMKITKLAQTRQKEKMACEVRKIII